MALELVLQNFDRCEAVPAANALAAPLSVEGA
jgi:hypothetical protein